MSVITLSNSQISVAIKTLGAELCSIKNKLNREFMWEGNPNFWGKHSPVLFPIVGTLKNNTFYHNDTKYTLTRHGFARDMEFELIEKTEDSATFSIQSNSATLPNYPFEFELQIQYTLINTTVEIDYKVVNKDNSEIPFSIGAHPAFALPSSFEDYNLDFEKVEPLEYTLLENDLVSQQTEKIHTDTNRVPLTYELFKRDALIFKKLQSNSLTIIEEEKPILKVHFQDFPSLGIWTKVGAPFICLEPWFGYSDTTESNGNLFEKEGVIVLEANAKFQAKFSIEIL
ncbi:aldose 1-epimerase family protein [Flavobacterium ammonificans]|jgi:galactose mutarotase-like enzyme|uniref:aldose 1-epimerase family protein n=1 Tax=Flavobacterium ammonificans TaxID=1751056 RepID=UPI001E645F6F|nr:aldose 1-epimerase family protein [Flavobacterium ammonificans]BDB57097.1 LACX protein [Flavobacterium ammonificans]